MNRRIITVSLTLSLSLTVSACFQSTDRTDIERTVKLSENTGEVEVTNMSHPDNSIPKPNTILTKPTPDQLKQEVEEKEDKGEKWALSTVIDQQVSKKVEAFNPRIDKNALVEIIAFNHYKQPSEVDVQQSMGGVKKLKSYLQELDNYSSYISADKVKYSIARNTLPRIGVGLDIIEHKGKLLAIPIEKGRLYKAGFTVPQYLKSIQGIPVNYEDFASYKVLAEMKESKSYSIGLVKNAYSSLEKISAKAEYTHKHLYSQYKKGQTTVLGIQEFTLDTREYLSSFFKSNVPMNSFVIDLRYCIGGNPGFAVDALGFFVGEEKLGVTLHSVEESKELETLSMPYQLKRSTKMTLLISEFTASSCEIFVHALKYYKPDLRIVGKPSAGKCLAQKPYLLEDGSVLKLSVYELIMADNQRCEGKPIQVDKHLNDIELMPLDKILREM